MKFNWKILHMILFEVINLRGWALNYGLHLQNDTKTLYLQWVLHPSNCQLAMELNSVPQSVGRHRQGETSSIIVYHDFHFTMQYRHICSWFIYISIYTCMYVCEYACVYCGGIRGVWVWVFLALLYAVFLVV